LSTMGRHRARACTHLDVDLAGIETAVQVISSAVTA
jgi:threonine aldolase